MSLRGNTAAALLLGGVILAVAAAFSLGLPDCADDEVIARGLFWFVCVKG